MNRIPAYALPTAVAASLVLLAAMFGLLALQEQRTILQARTDGLRQVRADVESAYAVYELHADEVSAGTAFRLFDSLPRSQVRIRREPWGLYELVHVAAADSLVVACRLYGIEPDARQTLCCADDRGAMTLAGNTVLEGLLRLPRNGIVYGRIGADAYRGPEIAPSRIRRSARTLPVPAAAAVARADSLSYGITATTVMAAACDLDVSFRDAGTVGMRIFADEIADRRLRGRIVLAADRIRIDSTCRFEHIIVVARNIAVGSGARISAQLFARDTLVVEERAVLEYPSGLFSKRYIELGEHSVVNGYAIVSNASRPDIRSANYRQERTAKLRGLLWVDGTAHVQGVIAGSAVLSQVVYFSPEGYYRNMLYDLTLLENPITAQPLWTSVAGMRRKEAARVE